MKPSDTMAIASQVLRKPQLVLFDWDNTLVDTWPLIRDAVNHTRVAFAMEPWDMETVQKTCHRSAREAFPVYFGQDSHQALEVFYRYARQHHLAQLTFLPGATALLDMLKEQSIAMGIVSNKEGDFLRKELDFLQVGHYFGIAVGSGDTPEDKPSPVPILHALTQFNVEASFDVWFVGDTPADWKAARASKVLSVGITNHNLTIPECDHTFNDLIQLSQFMGRTF